MKRHRLTPREASLARRLERLAHELREHSQDRSIDLREFCQRMGQLAEDLIFELEYPSRRNGPRPIGDTLRRLEMLERWRARRKRRLGRLCG